MTTPFESDLHPHTDDSCPLETHPQAHAHQTQDAQLDSLKDDDGDDGDDERDVDLALHEDDGRDAECQIDDVVEAGITVHDDDDSNITQKEHDHLHFEQPQCTHDRDEDEDEDEVETPFRTDSSEAATATAVAAAELPSSVELPTSELAPPPDPPPVSISTVNATHPSAHSEDPNNESLHDVTLAEESETHTLGDVPLSLSGPDEADAHQLVPLLPSSHDARHVNAAAAAAAAAMAAVVAATPPHLLTATTASTSVPIPLAGSASIDVPLNAEPVHTDPDPANMLHMSAGITPGAGLGPAPAPVKKKRRTYNTEEERRNARILKNRRTAEESRQRRLRRMTELEDLAKRASEREEELQRQLDQAHSQVESVSLSMKHIIQQKDELLAEKDAEIARLRAKLGIK